MTDQDSMRLALLRARSRLGAVRFAGTSTGGFDTYHVGSSQDVETAYRVTVDPDGVYRCTCPSELRPACVHRASVFLIRAQREAGGLAAAGPTVAEMRKEASRKRLEEIARQFA